jgi:hypothetical protein
MNATEIRDERTKMLTDSLRDVLSVEDGIQALQARVLYEIAAQLAELNDHIEYLSQCANVIGNYGPGNQAIKIHMEE